MISFFRKLWKSKRGNALVIAGAALPLVVGSAGLASDTIQWTLWKRQLQRAADSAAMAGVYAVVAGKTVDNCSNVSGATYNEPVAWDIKKNSHLFTTPTCSATNPPSTGGFTADVNAVRVSLSVQRSLSFSGMFLSTAPTITATATATIQPTGEYCVVSLEPTSTTGISIGGNAGVDLGCGMITNSTSMSAAIAFGSSTVNASPIAAVGGIPSGNWATGTVLMPFTVAQADPFANVPPPSFPTGNCPNFTVGSNTTVTAAQAAAAANTNGLASGVYCYGNMDIRGDVTFPANSVIILDGGDLNVNAQAHVTCTCTFVLSSRTAATNGNSIEGVSINGGAEMDITAPDTGPYAGLIFYQDRRANDCNNCNLLNGNSNSSFRGAFYFPSQEAQFNGTTGMSTACMQLVARRVTFSGNSAISNTCPTGSASGSFEGQKVRLVE